MTEPRPDPRQLTHEEIFHRYLTALGRAEAAARALRRLVALVQEHLAHCRSCECTLALTAVTRELAEGEPGG